MANSVNEFLNLIYKWVNNKPDIFGIALVGSHAINEARMNSDIDLNRIHFETRRTTHGLESNSSPVSLTF